jgi:hypothetical protein
LHRKEEQDFSLKTPDWLPKPKAKGMNRNVIEELLGLPKDITE